MEGPLASREVKCTTDGDRETTPKAAPLSNIVESGHSTSNQYLIPLLNVFIQMINITRTIFKNTGQNKTLMVIVAIFVIAWFSFSTIKENIG